MQPPNRLGAMLGYLGEAYRYAFAIQKADTRRLALSLLDGMAESTRYRDYSDTVDTAEAIKLAVTSAWVYSGIKLIADRVSSADARPCVKQRVGEELRDVRGHPFEVLLAHPNSLMTTEFIFRYTTFWAYLLGNAYLFISTPAPGVGVPEELWPLPANKMTPLPETIRISYLTGKPCIDYRYDLDNGKYQILPGENIVHIRFANVFDYWQGLSPLTALLDALRLDRYQSRYLQGFFGKDNAIPTAVISLPREIGDIDFEVAKEQIRRQFGEGRRSAIIRGGDMDVKTITQTLQQMEIVNARKFNREEINHVLGIPEGLISGGVSGDSRLATEITFVRNTVQPFLDMIAAELSVAIAPYYGQNIVIAAPNIIPQDRALRVQEYQQYSQDRNINENRRELNLPPLDLVGIMEQINIVRSQNGLEEITTPLDDVTVDLLMNVPVRLIAFISSNTFSTASKTGLRPGQKNAAGEEVVDPFEQLMELQQSGSEDNSAPPAYANVEKPPKVPDLPGMQGPKNEQQKQSGRSFDMSWVDHHVEAIKIGQREELQRWKKVAMKEARDGHDPSGRVFVSKAFPDTFREAICGKITAKSEDEVRMIFDTVIDMMEIVH